MRYIKDSEGRYCAPPVNGFFGLSYSSYYVIPRSALQALPLSWQDRFIALMKEAEEFGLSTPDDYDVRRRDGSGKFINDPWQNYRYPDDTLLPLSLRPPLDPPPESNLQASRGTFRTSVTEE